MAEPVQTENASQPNATPPSVPQKPKNLHNLLYGNGTVLALMGWSLKSQSCPSLTCVASCDSDKSVLSGGCNVEGNASVTASYPLQQNADGQLADGWKCAIKNHSWFFGASVKAYVICANIY